MMEKLPRENYAELHAQIKQAEEAEEAHTDS